MFWEVSVCPQPEIWTDLKHCSQNQRWHFCMFFYFLFCVPSLCNKLFGVTLLVAAALFSLYLTYHMCIVSFTFLNCLFYIFKLNKLDFPYGYCAVVQLLPVTDSLQIYCFKAASPTLVALSCRTSMFLDQRCTGFKHMYKDWLAISSKILYVWRSQQH